MNQTGRFEPLEIVVKHQDKQRSFLFELIPRIEPRRAGAPKAPIQASVKATATSEVMPAADKVANQ